MYFPWKSKTQAWKITKDSMIPSKTVLPKEWVQPFKNSLSAECLLPRNVRIIISIPTSIYSLAMWDSISQVFAYVLEICRGLLSCFVLLCFMESARFAIALKCHESFSVKLPEPNMF